MTGSTTQIRVCYIAGREATYSRTRVMLRCLAKAGCAVEACLPPDKRFRHYPALIWRFLLCKRRCDVVVVGFYGQLLMPFVRLFTQKPVLYDIYISTFDTMVYDRERACEGSLKAKIFQFVDTITLRMADRIILETEDHIHDYAAKFGIPESTFEHLFLTVDEEVISPRERNPKKGGDFLVHFHGEYAPFHGISTILRAAHLLRDAGVTFRLIGRGITYKTDRTLADELALTSVRFIDWVDYDKLADVMTEADCCLGIFGSNPRTLRVLTNKVVEALAAGRPLVTARNAPVQELVVDGESAILVRPADPEDLAGAILRLKNDPDLAKRIGANGRRIYKEKCSNTAFAAGLQHIIQQMSKQS